MSHAPERKERDCLNCGTITVGRFCHKCGQENIEPRESFWHLVTHFFNDITHFDGKFFQTLKQLLSRPGFLSREYMLGRRATYLNPIRMYVFTSAIFFLLFFSFFSNIQNVKINTIINGQTMAAVDSMKQTEFDSFTVAINRDDGKPAVPMTRQEFAKYADSLSKKGLTINENNFRSRREYDSALASGKLKHGWINRQLNYKAIALNQKYDRNQQAIFNAIRNSIFHSMPQMMFVSLPLLALLLKLLYIRRKHFYYVTHIIFSVHLYIFLFIVMLIIFSLSALNTRLQWNFISDLIPFFVFGLLLYEYLAMKNFYKQGWFKTFFKFLLTNIFYSILLLILFALFSIFSFFNI